MAVEVASEEYERLKAEIPDLARKANKRLDRLEANELTELPAYEAWFRSGHIRFSGAVAKKSLQELQSEYWRIKRFLDNKTSLVRGATAYLKEMANTIGIKYRRVSELKAMTKKFFELARKIEEYYRQANESARALDYQRIWEQINTAVKKKIIDLRGSETAVELLEKYLNAMDELTAVERMQEGYREASEAWDFIDI